MKSAEYYLGKGFPLREARYFAGGRKKIVQVIPEDGLSLLLQFDSGETRRLDVKPMIEEDTVFAFLADQEKFNRVYLDEDHCVAWDRDPDIDSRLVWNNKIDLSPEMCYLESMPV